MQPRQIGGYPKISFQDLGEIRSENSLIGGNGGFVGRLEENEQVFFRRRGNHSEKSI